MLDDTQLRITKKCDYSIITEILAVIRHILTAITQKLVFMYVIAVYYFKAGPV